MFKRFLSALVLVLVFSILGSCILPLGTDNNTDGSTTDQTVSVSEVSLDRGTISLVKGAIAKLNPKVLPVAAKVQSVSWLSSNPTVATVSTNGSITALAHGTASITVTSTDGAKTATCSVSVVPSSITALAFASPTLSMETTETYVLSATYTPQSASNEPLTWTSSNPTVASVWAGGSIQALTVGTSTITATNADGNVSASCVLTVTQGTAVNSVSLNHTESDMDVGDELTLVATILPVDASNMNVSWTSSNPEIASVSSGGVVKANMSGRATIKVITENGSYSANCQITVYTPNTGTTITIN